MLGPEGWALLENALRRSPDGSRWSAGNRPRCTGCHEPIGRSISQGEIHYLEYPGSVLLDSSPSSRNLASVLKSP
jgi:hypothetical protein